METLTRLVSESLARHGFDRPLDYRRLQWSRWFRCESHHSLLFVPSKPGVFALAEEVAQFCGASEPRMRHPEQSEGSPYASTGPASAHVETAASAVPRTLSEAKGSGAVPEARSRKPEAEVPEARRMLAVTQFFEADDMAFVLDRMLSRAHSMHSRLESGRYFVRYVEIQDETQRLNICNALNQWIVSSAEKATGIGSHFATSLELNPANEHQASEHGSNSAKNTAPLEAVTATTVQISPLFPSGF